MQVNSVAEGLITEEVHINGAAEYKPLSLRVNFSWTFAGNVVYAACQWGILVVLAKLGSPKMVGQFALGLAVTAPVIMFANLQLRAVQATDAKDEYRFGYYLSLRLVTTTLAFLVIVGIVALAGYRRETALVILAVGAAKCFESISDVIYGLMQKRERMDRIARSMMIKGPLSLTAMGVVLYITGSVLWGTIALACVWTGILFSYDIRAGIKLLRNTGVLFRPVWNPAVIWRLAWLSLPLGVVMMLISLNTNIPRYFVERYCGEEGLGYFAAMAYLMVAGGMIIRALGQAASPRLARYYVGDLHKFKRLMIKLLAIGAVLGISGILVTILIGREILTLLYQPDYAKHVDVFIWLMIAAGLGYIASFLGYGMTAVRYFKIQAPLFVFVLMVTFLLCALLVPEYGLIGAAQALCAGIILQLIGSAFVNVHALIKQRKKRVYV